MKVRAAMLALALFAGACASTPPKTDEPQPEPEPAPTDTRPCELTVRLRAEAKKGLRVLGKDADYGETGKPRADEKIKRVDYSHLGGIVVILDGPGRNNAEVEDQPKEDPSVSITDAGFSQDAVAVMLQRPRDDALARKLGGKMGNEAAAMAKSLDLGSSVKFTNSRKTPVTIFGAAGSKDSFEITLKPDAGRYVFFRNEGVYDVYCEEDEGFQMRVIVTGSAYVRTAKSGDDVKFFLPPGVFTVKVYAPRLPMWTAEVSFDGGGKAELTTNLGVNSLPKK
ncbi:MAG: hypothetical protein IT462_12650 [Planctomycetes bacterium]|nr:hypothetical protein [Planctomycetota bacterium]